MNEDSEINVREIRIEDINLLADYWIKSKPDYLVKMGVDLNKLPTRKELSSMLIEQINTPVARKKSYALVWELNGKQIGHSNVNGIEYGKQATMHLHMWESRTRKKGLPFYFEQLKIKKLICEPYTLNPAPNKTSKKIGFEFIKNYRTIPGSLNFEQDVNRWELTKEKFNYIKN